MMTSILGGIKQCFRNTKKNKLSTQTKKICEHLSKYHFSCLRNIYVDKTILSNFSLQHKLFIINHL